MHTQAMKQVEVPYQCWCFDVLSYALFTLDDLAQAQLVWAVPVPCVNDVSLSRVHFAVPNWLPMHGTRLPCQFGLIKLLYFECDLNLSWAKCGLYILHHPLLDCNWSVIRWHKEDLMESIHTVTSQARANLPAKNSHGVCTCGWGSL